GSKPYGYLLKPIEDRDLKRSIEIALYRRAAERQVQESERWLRTVVGVLGEGLVATDAQGHVQFMNPAAERLTGRLERQALGRTLPEVLDLQAPADGGGAHVLVSRSGRNSRVELSLAPVGDAPGDENGGVLVIHDVTERLRSQEERKGLEASLRRTQTLASM